MKKVIFIFGLAFITHVLSQCTGDQAMDPSIISAYKATISSVAPTTQFLINPQGCNVALNSSVTLTGTFFSGAIGWINPSPMTVSASTAVDGVFLPQSTRWEQGGVWWDMKTDKSPHAITLSLPHKSLINGFIVQADVNDRYLIYYRDLTNNNWLPAWTVPNVMYDIPQAGLQTRPDLYDNTVLHELVTPIITNELKIEADLTDPETDFWFSVSEIQAFGKYIIPASVDIDPGNLKLGTGKKWITAYITLPSPFDLTAFDLNTILLEGTYGIVKSDMQGQTLMVKFDAQDVEDCVLSDLGITPPDHVWLEVTGESTCAIFEGKDQIYVKN